MNIISHWLIRDKEDKFGDIIGVIRNRISKKDGQYSCQMKRDKKTNDLQNTTQKTKYRPTRTSIKPRDILGYKLTSVNKTQHWTL